MSQHEQSAQHFHGLEGEISSGGLAIVDKVKEVFSFFFFFFFYHPSFLSAASSALILLAYEENLIIIITIHQTSHIYGKIYDYLIFCPFAVFISYPGCSLTQVIIPQILQLPRKHQIQPFVCSLPSEISILCCTSHTLVRGHKQRVISAVAIHTWLRRWLPCCCPV